MEIPAIETLVPHRGVMLFVRKVVERLDDGIVCEGEIPAANPLVEAGRAPAILGVELAAQCAAALAGLEASVAGADGSAPRPGYLVSLRDVRFERPRIPAASRLVATVRRSGGAGPLSVYEAEVREPGAVEALLSATFSTFARSG